MHHDEFVQCLGFTRTMFISLCPCWLLKAISSPSWSSGMMATLFKSSALKDLLENDGAIQNRLQPSQDTLADSRAHKRLMSSKSRQWGFKRHCCSHSFSCCFFQTSLLYSRGRVFSMNSSEFKYHWKLLVTIKEYLASYSFPCLIWIALSWAKHLGDQKSLISLATFIPHFSLLNLETVWPCLLPKLKFWPFPSIPKITKASWFHTNVCVFQKHTTHRKSLGSS